MKIDKKSWQKGYEAGLRQQECQPKNTEVLSWHAGFLEGQEKAEVLSKFNCQTCGKLLIRREAKKREKEVKNNIGGGAPDSPIAGKHILITMGNLNLRRMFKKMSRDEMKEYADQRGMNLIEYKKWLDLQLELFDFDADEISPDVARHIAAVYGFEQAEPEFFLEGDA